MMSLVRVLIIGCGYVGLPLGAELVRQGHQVEGIRRTPGSARTLRDAEIKPRIIDITQFTELAQLAPEYDWVVNCVSSSRGGGKDYEAVYLLGTRNLIEWLTPTPPKKFVYTSSTSVYGQTDGSIVEETSPTDPQAETAKILVAAENLLLQAAEMIKFPAIILRVAGIYGPGRGYWFKQYLKGEAIIEGKGERILNMIHRDDVVGAIIAALKNGQSGELYNAVDDQPVTQIEFFQWLSDRLRKPLPQSLPEEGITVRKRELTSKRVSNRKLKQELGYTLTYSTFRQGYAAEVQRFVKI